MSITVLSNDVLGCILTHIPDFDTLYAASSAYKRLDGVYQAHYTSVIREVAYNMMGPAYLVARKVFFHGTASDSMGNNNPVIHDDQHMLDQFPKSMKKEHIEFLQDNARLVRELEDLFSIK